MSKKETQEISIRSSAAEYLTFIAASGQGGIEAIYADENVWLTQKMMGTLYDVATNTINHHLKKVFSDNELEENSVIRNFRITASDGKIYNTYHYEQSDKLAEETSLAMQRILAENFKVDFWRDEDAKKHTMNQMDDFFYDQLNPKLTHAVSIELMDDIIKCYVTRLD